MSIIQPSGQADLIAENESSYPASTKPISRDLRRLLNLHAAWAEVVSSTGDLPELVAAVLVSPVVAKRLGTGPLWLLLVGPPSSSKTQAVQPARILPSVYFLDSLTENSFVSGYVPEGGKAQDLLGELLGKCLIVKDLTSFLSMREETVKKVLGDLCSVYDGSFSKFTGTRGKVSYQTEFPFLACVTPQALDRHSRYMSSIGPRFIYYRLPALSPEQREEGFEISWSPSGSAIKQRALQAAMTLLVHPILKRSAAEIDIGPRAQEFLSRLAELLAGIRANVNYVRVEGKNYYEPDSVQREEPWRAVQQLKVLAASLALVHGREQVTGHELEMVRRVAISCTTDARWSLLQLFSLPSALVKGQRRSKGKRYSYQGVTCNTAAHAMGRSASRAKQVLRELCIVGVIQEAGKSRKGDTIYVPAPAFDDLLREPTCPLDHPADVVT